MKRDDLRQIPPEEMEKFLQKNMADARNMTPEEHEEYLKKCGAEQYKPRGEEIATKLAALIVEKMEKRAHKGDWKELSIETCLKLLEAEQIELNFALMHQRQDKEIKRGCDDYWDIQKANKLAVIDEIADVAAYCAIMLDVLDKE